MHSALKNKISTKVDKFAMTHECFERGIEAINDSTTIEELLASVPSVMPIKLASYHHFASVGAFDFKSLNQYFSYKMPQVILDYLDTYNQHRTYPNVVLTFSKGQFLWLSDMEEELLESEPKHIKRVQQTLEITGDALCIPLYGPNNRYGYMFIAFGMSKSDCKTVTPFQIQALAQKLHVRYCLMIEKLQKQIKLTAREAEVLELITFGKTNAEIGEVLNISSNTVAGYVKQVFLKLEVSDRVSAAMRAQTIQIVI